METKALIRKRILALRERMSLEEKAAAEQKITEKLLGLSGYIRADVVLGFVGYGSETDTLPFLEQAVKEGKKVYCPVSRADGIMEFYRFTKREDLKEGYKKIPEPSGAGERFDKNRIGTERPQQIFMLMPGVAFDRHRHRIGYGKGFYDRYLADFKPDRIAAVCFECQLTEEVPTEEYDILPDLLITENRILECVSQKRGKI